MNHFLCIKTGFYAILPGQGYLYGDAFAVGFPGSSFPDDHIIRPPATLLLRIASLSLEVPQRVHIRLDTWEQWFDERRGEHGDGYTIWSQNSTLIATPGQWTWLGYDGVLT